MKRKLVMCIAAASMVASLCACGTKEASVPEQEPDNSPAVIQEQEPVEEEKVDDTDVKIEVVDGNYQHTEEYNKRFAVGERYSGVSNTLDPFSSWQEAYRYIIEESGKDEQFPAKAYALINVDGDDIPELIYSYTHFGEDGMMFVTFDGAYPTTYGMGATSVDYIEGGNAIFASERRQSSYYDYVFAVNTDGWLIDIALGMREPMDEWAEDSFDENGEPIISSWTLNDETISSQAKYDEAMGKFFDRAYCKTIIPSEDAQTVLSKIN